MNIDKLKSIIEKKVKQTGVTHQHVYDMYFFERFLYRLSLSEYRNNFIFKGGFLLENIMGIDVRTTMDIDLKIEKIELERDKLIEIFVNISNINGNDDIIYEVVKITNILAGQKYDGFSVHMEAKLKNVKKRFCIDVATGDIITPNAQKYTYVSKIDESKFQIYSYNKETIIAEKFETLIAKGLDNSRSKDLYDIYILMNSDINTRYLKAALINTFINRKNKYEKKYIQERIKLIVKSDNIKNLFERYVLSHSFARNVKFCDVEKAIYKIEDHITNIEKVQINEYNVKLHIVRHGQDDINKVGGWSSNHLTEEGIREIEALTNFVDDDYDLFISSDLNRAKESSLILNEKLKMNIIYDDQFRETNNGDLKDLTKEEFNKKYPGLYYSSLQMDECYPNGESPIEFYNRIKKAFIKLIETNKNKKIILVTHGGVITVINCLINGLPYSNLLKIVPKTGTITKIK